MRPQIERKSQLIPIAFLRGDSLLAVKEDDSIHFVPLDLNDSPQTFATIKFEPNFLYAVQDSTLAFLTISDHTKLYLVGQVGEKWEIVLQDSLDLVERRDAWLQLSHSGNHLVVPLAGSGFKVYSRDSVKGWFFLFEFETYHRVTSPPVFSQDDLQLHIADAQFVYSFDLGDR